MPAQPTVFSTVTSQVDKATEYADDSFNAAVNYLNSIKDYATSLQVPALSLQLPNININALPTVAAPPSRTPPSLQQASLNIPSPPSLDSASVTLPSEPADFTEPAPATSLPGAPSISPSVNIGAKPPFSETYPQAPTVSLPAVPTLESLNIPSAPSVTLPTLSDISLPTIPANTIPGTLTYTPSVYQESYTNDLKNVLLDMIANGKLGLPVTIEQQLWDRAKDREIKNQLKAEEELKRSAAQQGFHRPTGVYQAQLNEIRMETQHKIAELSREVAIKQAELLNQNFQFAIERALTHEGLLFNIYNTIEERSFRVKELAHRIAVDVYNASLEAFRSELALYNTYYEVGLKKIQQALATLEVYKAQLEGESIKNELNKSKIDIYRSTLEGVKVEVDVFRSQVEAINQKLQGKLLDFEAYKSEIQSEAQKLQLDTERLNQYALLAQAEAQKLSSYEAKVRAHAANVAAYSSKVEARKAVAEVKLQNNRSRIDAYLGQLQGLSESSKVIAQQNLAELQAFQAQLQNDQTFIESQKISAQAAIEQYKAIGLISTEQSKLLAESAKYNIENLKYTQGIVIKSLEEGASVTSQLAAASLAAVNIGAHVQSSGSTNYNYNIKAESSGAF